MRVFCIQCRTSCSDYWLVVGGPGGIAAIRVEYISEGGMVGNGTGRNEKNI